MLFKLSFLRLQNAQDAEDVVQEVFYQYLKKPRTFQSPEHEKAWFIRTTINVCKNLLKNKWNRDMVQLQEWDEGQAFQRGTGDAFEELKEAILDLPEKYRIPIHLYYYEEYSVREIAKFLRMNESTVQTHLQRGREKIKQVLERSEDYDVGA